LYLQKNLTTQLICVALFLNNIRIYEDKISLKSNFQRQLKSEADDRLLLSDSMAMDWHGSCPTKARDNL